MGSIYADVSPPCRDNIKSAFEEIHEKVYTKEGRKELVQKLELDADFPTEVMPVDIQFFLSNVIGIFQGINQYTGDNRVSFKGGEIAKHYVSNIVRIL
ncbi:unnamed protein product [Anisakis simplex]|uniref:TetR_C_8 domain-containing protein n=1 Tax=Anisakis simplex TaxID=6269 RepID=A0A0M3KKM5_ANISI|nr:unnamed protein product [Anisakis simplex]